MAGLDEFSFLSSSDSASDGGPHRASGSMPAGNGDGLPHNKAYVIFGGNGGVPKAETHGTVPNMHIPMGNLTAPPANRPRLDDSLERQRNVPRAPCASVSTEEAQTRPMAWRNPPPSDG